MSPQKMKFLAVRVYRARDTKAFDELYEEFRDRLYRFVVHKLPRGEDAEELTNEVFLRGWEYMTSSDVDHVAAFFYRIARNLIVDFYRRHKLTQPLVGESEMLMGGSLETQVADQMDVAVVTEKVRGLRPEYGEVIVMRFFNEMTVEEIAEALEKTPNNIRVLIHRARKALEESLQKS